MITKNPSVGKYIVSQSIMTYGFSGNEFGEITKMSGSRIYYVNQNGLENYITKFSAVCDTFDECLLLVSFSRKCVSEVMELNRLHKSEFEKFFNE